MINWRRVGAWCGGVLASVLSAAPVSAQPADARGGQGLYDDVERIVAVEETTYDWFLDEDHLTRIYPTVLRSLCQATPTARRAALETARADVAKRGDPAKIFAVRQRRTTEVDDALHAARIAAALERGLASEASCPFWVRPEPGFVGRQRDIERLTVNVETGGVAQVRQSGTDRVFGGAGGVRLLAGYGIGRRVKLLLGGELAGGALFRFREASRFGVALFPAVPFVLRINDGSVHFDFEAAPVGFFTADDRRLSYGVRGGFGLGVSVLRTRSVIPWAGPAIAYEHHFAGGGRAAADVLRGGIRVGIVWDPFID